jgi:hypothetical protein
MRPSQRFAPTTPPAARHLPLYENHLHRGIGGAGGRLDRLEGSSVVPPLLKLSYTEIRAPISGFVNRQAVNPGDNVQAGQGVIAIVALDELANDLWPGGSNKTPTDLIKTDSGQYAHDEIQIRALVDRAVANRSELGSLSEQARSGYSQAAVERAKTRHRAMPRDQFGKGDLVAIGQEPLQELPLAKPGERPTLDREMSEQMTRALTRHAGRSATAVPIATKGSARIFDLDRSISKNPNVLPILIQIRDELRQTDKGTRA